MNITFVTARKSRQSQPRSRRTQIRSLQADNRDDHSLDVVPVDQSEVTLAGGDAGSNVTVEEKYVHFDDTGSNVTVEKDTHVDDESDFEVIHDDSGTEAADVEMLHRQDSDSDSSSDVTDHPDDTH